MTAIKNLAAAWVILSLAACAFLGGCTAPQTPGPTVGVRNDSNTTLRVRFYVGDRADRTTAGADDLRNDRDLEVRPGTREQYKLGLLARYQSTAESFVRVQVEPIGASFERQAQYWFELNPPAPFTIRVYGEAPDLKFDRDGRGGMVAVPKHLQSRPGR